MATEMANSSPSQTATVETETDIVHGRASGSAASSHAARDCDAKADKLGRVLVGCDFGSTTAKAVCLSPEKELLFSCYALSQGNPIEDAKVCSASFAKRSATAKFSASASPDTAKILLKGILGADCPVVETIAHASAGLHYFPDADCICDVGGVDVKIMMLNNGAVTDFRLNSQCSSGNGAFLQGVAERFSIPMSEMADRAFNAEVHAATFDGMRRFPAERHRQPAAQGLAGGGNSRRAVRHSSAERLDLRGRHEQPLRRWARNIFCRAARTRISPS